MKKNIDATMLQQTLSSSTSIIFRLEKMRFLEHAVQWTYSPSQPLLPGACYRNQVAGLLRNPDTGDEVWDECLRYAP